MPVRQARRAASGYQLALAIDEWLKSEDGVLCRDKTWDCVGMEYRLKIAFVAGFDAAERIRKETAKRKRAKK